MDDSVKKAFMDAMESEFKREFGYDLKTIMLFADAVCNVQKQNNENIEQLKKERDKYKDRYEILNEKIWLGHFGDLEDMINEWDEEDKKDEI